MLNIRPNKQQGVALIIALIITSIAVSLAATIMYRQQIQIRLSSNISHLEQAYLYANGMEDWAGTILEKSYREHPKYDSHEDDWYSDNALVLPVTGGLMTGKLYDLQARINVNSIGRPKPPLPPAPQSGQQASPPKPYIAEITRNRLKRLVNQIDPDQDMGPPENFVDILKDWIDKDQDNGNREPDGDSSGNGAESPYYQSLEPAYYSANTEMVSPTEFRLLKGMNEKIYAELKNYTNTLPTKPKKQFQITNTINAAPPAGNQQEIKTPINVNTASEEVLKAIGFDPGAIENILELRKEEPFKTFDEFKALNMVALAIDPDNGTVNPADLDVKSDYFLLEGSVEINNARLFINSILERKNGQVSVIMRDFSNPEIITNKTNEEIN